MSNKETKENNFSCTCNCRYKCDSECANPQCFCHTFGVGDIVPNLSLDTVINGTIKTINYPSELLNDWLVCVFIPLAFTPICKTELAALSKITMPKASVVGISTDSAYTLREWAKVSDITIPLVSDFEKTLTKKLGIYVQGMAYRGTYIIDPNKQIRWAMVNDLSVGRSVEEIQRVLAALQTGKMCPVNWNQGDDHI